MIAEPDVDVSELVPRLFRPNSFPSNSNEQGHRVLLSRALTLCRVFVQSPCGAQTTVRKRVSGPEGKNTVYLYVPVFSWRTVFGL